MDFKFSKDSGNSQSEGSPGEKKNQNSLLVLLLILVGGFTYIYFFTGLIKPLEVPETAKVPDSATQAVKIPLPARESEPAKVNGEAPAKAEAPKTAASSPAPATVSPAKPVAPPAAKAAPTAATQKEEPKKAAAAKPADKKSQTVAVADKKSDKAVATKTETKTPVADAKKIAITDKKSPPIKKPAAEVQAKPKTIVTAKKDTPDSWSLVVGNYVLEEALSADMGRVRKAGFVPVVKPDIRKKTNMNRLFVSDFNDRATAQATLEKLKRHTSDAFIIEQGGRFAVYAGSYLQSGSASSEKERLKVAGFSTTIKHSDISIPSQSLSIGPFANKKAAIAALGRLKSAGIKAIITQK